MEGPLSMSHQCPPLGATGPRHPSRPKNKRLLLLGKSKGQLSLGHPQLLRRKYSWAGQMSYRQGTCEEFPCFTGRPNFPMIELAGFVLQGTWVGS